MEKILAHVIVWLMFFGLVILLWCLAIQELIKAKREIKGRK